MHPLRCVYPSHSRAGTYLLRTDTGDHDSDGEKDVLSAFSAPAQIIGGLKDPDILKNHFITVETEEDIKKARGTYLRKEFSVEKEIARL